MNKDYGYSRQKMIRKFNKESIRKMRNARKKATKHKLGYLFSHKEPINLV